MAPLHVLLQNYLTKLAKEWLKQQLNYLVYYESRLQKLDKDVKKLQNVRDKVQLKVDEEETRYGNEIDVDVQNWLDGVDKIISEYENFKKDEDSEYAVCSGGFLPRWGIRRRLSMNADDITKKVNGQLQKAPSHDTFSHWHGPPSMDAVFSNFSCEIFPSRNKTIDKMMEALKDSNVRMIGVHGLSGVGKTTLVIQVAKKAWEAKLFNVVVLANVTRNPDIKDIQGQIADMLGLKLEEESEIGRAARIRERLKNEKESTLIILDDLLEKLDFNILGFPDEHEDGSQKNLKGGRSLDADNMKKSDKLYGAYNKTETKKDAGDSDKKESEDFSIASSKMKTGEPLNRHKGCKILLISDSRQVLLRQMDGNEKSIFSVEGLRQKEAETLFKTMAGIDDENSDFERLSAQIAGKCGGLPMSIVTTAKALKNQRRPVWEDVNRKLDRQKLSGTLEYSIKLSYELLGDEELKYTFLLCARMGRDILIMDFVKYCIGLGFLRGVYAVREARDRVLALLLKLKESSLLSECYSSDRFTMQDVVQGAALSIASKEKQVFMMTKGKLDEWPDKDELKRYAAISIRHCHIIEFPERINSSRLRVFHLDSIDQHLKIPDDFFKGMTELRVLILIGIHSLPLPSSISCLMRLRMLCLERCTLGEELDFIGELKNLRVLSLVGSDFEKLPAQLSLLTKLQILDISNCSKLTVIPRNIISSLTSLEDLYMRNILIKWKDEEEENPSENASLSELRHLNQLTTLDIQIRNVAHLPTNLFFDKLDNYKIVIGDLNAYLERDFKMPEKHEASRFLALQLEDGFDIHSQKVIKMLFERVENLLLGDLNGVECIFNELNLKGFPYLQHLSIVSNNGVKYIINSKVMQHPEKAFTKLETMCLYKLKNMKRIFKGQLKDASFCKLKIIKISMCGQLKNVFFSSMVRFLTALETIEVSECNSLKEIVVVENINDKIEFPRLHSLKLQSLSEFVGFYAIPNRQLRELFDEKVVISELERMELSMIEINTIWSDTCSPRSFGKLTHLDVNGCGSLTYLLSISMAKNLANLQSLFVSECEKMETIFKHEETSSKDSIFPKLNNIKLSCMKRLRNIWQRKDLSNSFGKLDTLVIEECDKLHNVFPCDMLGRFQSLCNLRVAKCKSMEVIFDLKNDGKQDAGLVGVTNLQNVHLEALPKLNHVWKKESDGAILNFKNLQKIWIRQCPNLQNIFPLSVAKSLKNFEYLVVWDCSQLEQIVANGNSSNTSNIQFDFPELATIKFSELPKLKSFYPGAYLRCSALNDLSVELCDELEPFRSKPEDPEIKPVFLPEEVIYNLKSMQIEQWHANWLKGYIGNYRMDNLEELRLSNLVDHEILYFFLYRNPNLESLWLNNCFFEELIPSVSLPTKEKFGIVPRIRSLNLTNLPSLKDIGFERDIFLQMTESLILKKCPRLHTMVPSSVSLTHLTYLEVVDCGHLTTLMAPSTAKNLVHLTTMKVIQCRRMEEIVSQNGNEQENEGKIAIAFRKLKVLELVFLPRLSCFCSSSSFTFDFPSLEKLVVSLCQRMKSFSEAKSNAPMLRQIYIAYRKEEQKYCCWEGDLNATIKKMFNDKLFYEGADKAQFGNVVTFLGLQRWDREFEGPGFWFDSLKTLKLRNCNFGSRAIKATILPHLRNLTNLQIQNCLHFELIFDQNDSEIKGTTFLLKKLTLDRLPKLTQVWDKNSEGILSFQNLQRVVVTKCGSLETLFPAKLAKNLKKLEELEIRDCQQLQEIVGKEEAAAEELLFPSLCSLNLDKLPQLTSLHPVKLIQEELNRLDVLRCGRLELFQSEQEARPEVQGGTSANQQPLSSFPKVISNLEALTLNWKDTSMLCERQPPNDHPLHKLNRLKLWFDDVNEVSILPFELFQKAPNLIVLQLGCCRGLKDIFPSESDVKIGKEGIFEHLNEMSLFELFELESIGLEHLWVGRLFEELHILTVTSCPRLTTLVVRVQPEVSFSRLKQLIIEDCRGLKNLFTSSIARKLMHLQEMHIRQCESMKEIVAEGEDETLEEIKFERLKTIVLDSLASLLCFYSGNATLELPCLIQVVVRQCPRMRFFSQRIRLAESFTRIQVSLDSDDALVLQDDLNARVKTAFLQLAHLVLGDDPLLQEIWLGKAPVPDRSFGNLKSLVVEGCEFLSKAVLPSHLLSFLSNLEELQVRKCKSIEAIFDHTKMIDMGPASDPLSIHLKKLVLDQLPNLKHVWNKDLQGSLRLSFLEEVLVDRCESIKSLFPASVAKKLKKLDVQNCEGLVEIVAKDEENTEGPIKDFIFPSLFSLRLWNLPNLKCIYPGMHIQEWPKLKDLDISLCQMLKIFATDSQNSPDSRLEGQDRFRKDQQAFVSLEKVTRGLEQLSLSKEDTMMIEQRKLHVDLQKLKFLKFQCFDQDSDVFPYVLLSKVPLPSIKKLGVVDSAFKEIFPKPNIDDTKISTVLDGLKLQTLVVMKCNCLTNLVPSTVSFSHLRELIVENCGGLKYLFTSSVAKSLGLLNKMCITNCVSIEKVVSKEVDKPDENEMIFWQLKILSLSKLPILGSFYTGNSALNFPSLEEVSFTRCHNMKTFCHGDVIPKNLQGKIDGIRWYGDLNIAVKRQFGEGSSLS